MFFLIELSCEFGHIILSLFKKNSLSTELLAVTLEQVMTFLLPNNINQLLYKSFQLCHRLRITFLLNITLTNIVPTLKIMFRPLIRGRHFAHFGKIGTLSPLAYIINLIILSFLNHSRCDIFTNGLETFRLEHAGLDFREQGDEAFLLALVEV
jgi:hypothetical protein